MYNVRAYITHDTRIHTFSSNISIIIETSRRGGVIHASHLLQLLVFNHYMF